ncbi:hypothetical protein L1987_82124 [Smallanthus sonchifolius]|uniref:Uncharacterized protein n=1 Tax=Smallanthus sonchifolius TaxID=185202 RepID=A0ACB8YSB8_9ASTR|nr:hypothetical protein L1987_82124 [Smallanthus sonchifolius]
MAALMAVLLLLHGRLTAATCNRVSVFFPTPFRHTPPMPSTATTCADLWVPDLVTFPAPPKPTPVTDLAFIRRHPALQEARHQLRLRFQAAHQQQC